MTDGRARTGPGVSDWPPTRAGGSTPPAADSRAEAQEASAAKLLEEVTWHQRQINRLLATLLARVAEDGGNAKG
jgi:hypothetical protein